MNQPRWVIGLMIAAPIVVVIGSFLAIWQFLTPAERVVMVPYSDFMAEVHAGRVEEIKIHDRDIRYRTHASDGRVFVKGTVGPVPDQAFVDSLKPDDKDKPPPKIFFER